MIKPNPFKSGLRLRHSESENIEYKSNWNDDYLKVISAFANTKGGELIIGVDDNKNISGIINARKLLVDLPNKIKDKLGIIPAVKIEKKKGKEIIIVKTELSSVPISYDGRYYMRSGSTTQQLQGQQLTDFLIRKSGKTWDEFIEAQASFDDIDIETVQQFKKYAVDRIPSIVKETNIKTLINKLGLIENDRLKRAAILLFGKNPQKFYIPAIVKIGKFLTETEILSSDLIRGNLFEQLEKTLETLRTKYLISEIKYEGIHRRDILEYPYESLREAIINALIHRDYLGTSNIQIRVYSDKLIIMNEGKLPPEVPVEKLKTKHLSKPRNTLLAEVFYFAGFIESWGRGTIKIVENCVEQELPEPDFIEEFGTMNVIFYKDKWTEKNLEKMGLNERQIKAVMYVKEKGKITNEEYQKLAGVSKPTATRHLSQLVNLLLFEQIGMTGKGTFYRIKGSQTAQMAHKGLTNGSKLRKVDKKAKDE
ncbi:MAG TPA: transcriptional regulator [Candidatus Atribacteria bacterium]|uniref:Putative transcriptional regulator n=1 Tax=candidate division TA06 bacterium 34_109 TaxID=1635277 RepID=A0A101I154_UNCT6|nr:MAG: Putative transcriptional regulator [candidate division TA06 bacterium 34_109]HBY57386.1 transcriptional regulator [Candidatus Atribacteria bacterium]